MSAAKIKKALVLDGGGGWGRVQAASLYTLHEAGVLDGVDAVFSNSVGSINAMLYCAGLMAGQGADFNKEAWQSIRSNTQVISPDFMAIAANPIGHAIAIGRLGEGVVLGQGALDNGPLKALIKRYASKTTTNDLEARLGIVWRAQCYHNGEGRGRLMNGMFYHMAVASSSIELAFPAHLGLSDGGPADNCPAGYAIQGGAEKIVVIYCGSDGPAPTDAPVWVDDSTPEPGLSAKQVGRSLLENITNINEAEADEELDRAEAAGTQVVRCWSRTPVTGSILQFEDPDMVRWNQGVAAAMLALADAKAYGWVQ
ncbi:MAG TPA: patatin-like phospholipase family protein [bacterium]|jgi:predicted acylesterase/phospholipase RssA|nr:patatin-like phospholipase family protein [bacterium]